jgi:hypothetical protein
MKQYVIDELRAKDYSALKNYLARHFVADPMDGIYWIPIDSEILTETQKRHRDCRPHYFAVELDENRMACELLVRTQNIIRCDCIRYATETQRNWLIALIDHILNQLEIVT